MPVITSDSVLANQEELSSVDETTSAFSEDLPDPNPGIISEPTPEFILYLTVNPVPIHDNSKTFSASDPRGWQNEDPEPRVGGGGGCYNFEQLSDNCLYSCLVLGKLSIVNSHLLWF